MCVHAWVVSLEDVEAERSSVKVKLARQMVARRVGVSPGTLENLRKGRTKRPAFDVVELIRAEFVREAQRQVSAWEHRLQIAKQAGAHPVSSAMAEAMAHLQTAKRLLASL